VGEDKYNIEVRHQGEGGGGSIRKNIGYVRNLEHMKTILVFPRYQGPQNLGCSFPPPPSKLGGGGGAGGTNKGGGCGRDEERWGAGHEHKHRKGTRNNQNTKKNNRTNSQAKG